MPQDMALGDGLKGSDRKEVSTCYRDQGGSCLSRRWGWRRGFDSVGVECSGMDP